MNSSIEIAEDAKVIEYDSSVDLTLIFSLKDAILDVKNKSIDVKVDILKHALHENGLVNRQIILNILSLLKTSNTFEDAYFNRIETIFSSIEDFLDVKYALLDDLKDFSRLLSIYYISIFKSVSKIEIDPIDNIVDIPEIYKSIFEQTDMLTMAGILSKLTDIDINDIPFVKDAMFILFSLTQKFNIMGSIASIVLNKL